MNKFTFPKTTLALVLASSLLLSACGSDEQDVGEISNNEQVFGGRAIDGHLARATVFIDSNNNGTRDAWEAFAFTDNEGFYSYNPNTDTDYCADDASPQEAQYCLVSNIAYSNVVVRVDGGYDILTGEPFLGQMSRRVNAETPDDSANQLISPLTSLMTDIPAESQADLLTSLNMQPSDLNVDYLDPKDGSGVDASLLNSALKVHKTVTVLSDRLTDVYDEIGNEIGTPNDASSIIYPNLAQQILDSANTLDATLSSASSLLTVISNAEQQTLDLYNRKDFDLPTLSNSQISQSFDRVTTVSTNINAVIDALFDDDDAMTPAAATGSARAVETLVLKTVKEGSRNDTSIESALDFFNNTESNLVDTLIDSLSNDNADISALVNSDFNASDFDSEEEIRDIAQLAEGASSFLAIGGKSLKVSDLDLGNPPTNVDDAEVEFYFDGNGDDISGSFTACVKFIDGGNANTGDIGEASTRGELVFGYWSKLGATPANPESFSVLLTITFLGTTYQAILKPGGTETIDDTDYTIARFDFGGDLRAFHSDTWFQSDTPVPTTNSQCEERLPSRVGL